jgi:hypothetical protein
MGAGQQACAAKILEKVQGCVARLPQPLLLAGMFDYANL